MATSLIGGLVEQDQVNAGDLLLYEPDADKAKQVASEYQISLASNNDELVLSCDVVVIAVKPQVLQRVLTPLATSFSKNKPLIVSVVAGIRAESIEQWLNCELAVVRVMPNTPALIGKGASGLFANKRVSAAQKSLTQNLMNAVGIAAWVASEADIDSVTALSGSGPAYFMLFIQGLIDAAIQAGIAPESAKALAVQTAAGAAELVAGSEHDLQTLIDNVTSPNGTTEAALKSFHADQLTRIVSNAFNAAKHRSEQLAEELS